MYLRIVYFISFHFCESHGKQMPCPGFYEKHNSSWDVEEKEVLFISTLEQIFAICGQCFITLNAENTYYSVLYCVLVTENVDTLEKAKVQLRNHNHLF